MSIFTEVLKLTGCVSFPYIGGIAGALTVPPNRPWYDDLNKPSFTLPSWVFGPAWGILYGVIGLASYFVLQQGLLVASIPLALYLVHLALNWTWTPVFFGLHQIKTGAIVIVAITISGIITAISFFTVSPIAGWLFVPYLIWLTYASYLNIGVAILNPTE
ncbi:hypothetical protein Aperf_G00000121245 [Anoplocephala perfoliata]